MWLPPCDFSDTMPCPKEGQRALIFQTNEMQGESLMVNPVNVVRTMCGFAFLLFLPHTTYGKPKRHSPYRSQFKQDKYLHNLFFKDKRGGTFIEIGAADGVRCSNTLFFERYLGWKGMCIEPSPEPFKELQKNRKSICVNRAISDKAGGAQFVVSGLLSGLREPMDPRHVNRIQKTYKKKVRTITVQCCRLDELMKQHNIKHVDYLSLDVEGGEMNVLRSINWDKVTIDVLSVEGNYSECWVAHRAFLESKGYVFVRRLWGDDIFCRSGFQGITSHEQAVQFEQKQEMKKHIPDLHPQL